MGRTLHTSVTTRTRKLLPGYGRRLSSTQWSCRTKPAKKQQADIGLWAWRRIRETNLLASNNYFTQLCLDRVSCTNSARNSTNCSPLKVTSCFPRPFQHLRSDQNPPLEAQTWRCQRPRSRSERNTELTFLLLSLYNQSQPCKVWCHWSTSMWKYYGNCSLFLDRAIAARDRIQDGNRLLHAEASRKCLKNTV